MKQMETLSCIVIKSKKKSQLLPTYEKPIANLVTIKHPSLVNSIEKYSYLQILKHIL